MSKVFGRILGYFSNRNFVGMDKAGNRYFARNEVIDGVTKEKRWVKFKEEEKDPTSIPVEWICWLNGQRKRAPTPEEMAELEARREFVRQNVERLKKEEEERRAVQGTVRKIAAAGKVGGPDLQTFLRQVPKSEGEAEGTSEAADDMSKDEEIEEAQTPPRQEPTRTTEPVGSGPSFKPGTWQPPS